MFDRMVTLRLLFAQPRLQARWGGGRGRGVCVAHDKLCFGLQTAHSSEPSGGKSLLLASLKEHFSPRSTSSSVPVETLNYCHNRRV